MRKTIKSNLTRSIITCTLLIFFCFVIVKTNAANLPKSSLVGYVIAYKGPTPPSAQTNEMITEALEHKYNVFVYAFGYIDNNNKVSIPDNITDADLKTQIAEIHNNKGIALLTFGGQDKYNTFKPNPADPVSAANNTYDIINTYNFDGVDLDLEVTTYDSSFLVPYINQLRTKMADIIITAAPQIQGGWGGPATLSPSIFDKDFLTDAKFNALFVQNYNQFGGAKFNGLEDTDKGFITASFSIPAGPIQDMTPTSTKIIVGEPATSSAGSGLSPGDIVEDINDGKVVKSVPQYGGIMVWAINYDFDQNWLFADTVTKALPITSK